MKTLVTGGAGFIGSHLIEAILAKGHDVRVLDSFRTGKRENLAPHGNDIELVEGDVCDPEACKLACAGVERVWHLAGMASVPESVADPAGAYAINVTGTLNMLEAASAAGAKRFVFASSCAVYGDNPQLPARETNTPAPTSPYAETKLEAERRVCAFSTAGGLETVALRFFNVYGPRQSPESDYASVVPRFIVALLEGRQPTIYGDGEQSRDFIYVADIAHANLLAGLNDGAGIAGENFNVGAGQSFTVNQLLEAARQAVGSSIEAIYMPERKGDIRHSSASIDKAVAKLGFQPQWSLNEGIAETARSFIEARKQG